MTDQPRETTHLSSSEIDTSPPKSQTHTTFLAVSPRPLSPEEERCLRKALQPASARNDDDKHDRLQVLILPEDAALDTDRTLPHTMKALHALRAVLTFGITAHIAVIDACGMPWSRVPYRPCKLTALPDGLIVANLPLDIWNEPGALDEALMRLNEHAFETA